MSQEHINNTEVSVNVEQVTGVPCPDALAPLPGVVTSSRVGVINENQPLLERTQAQTFFGRNRQGISAFFGAGGFWLALIGAAVSAASRDGTLSSDDAYKMLVAGLVLVGAGVTSFVGGICCSPYR